MSFKTSADNQVLAFLDGRVDTARENNRLCLAGYGGPTTTASVSSKAEHKVEIMVVKQKHTRM